MFWTYRLSTFIGNYELGNCFGYFFQYLGEFSPIFWSPCWNFCLVRNFSEEIRFRLSLIPFSDSQTFLHEDEVTKRSQDERNRRKVRIHPERIQIGQECRGPDVQRWSLVTILQNVFFSSSPLNLPYNELV